MLITVFVTRASAMVLRAPSAPSHSATPLMKAQVTTSPFHPRADLELRPARCGIQQAEVRIVRGRALVVAEGGDHGQEGGEVQQGVEVVAVEVQASLRRHLRDADPNHRLTKRLPHQLRFELLRHGQREHGGVAAGQMFR